VTSWPRSTSIGTSRLPRAPVAPAMKILIRGSLRLCFPHREDGTAVPGVTGAGSAALVPRRPGRGHRNSPDGRDFRVPGTDARVAVAIAIEELEVVRGHKRVLPGISLTIKRGVVTGLVGPSGSGKTT